MAQTGTNRLRVLGGPQAVIIFCIGKKAELTGMDRIVRINTNALLHEELTEKFLSACFEVAHELGAGFLESVYEKALIVALRQKGLDVEAQVPLTVKFRGFVVGEYFADILVKNKLIIELKSVTALRPEHQAQVINYLKATGIDVGLLVNFGNPKLEYRRLHK